ncbi:uncharacterized protein LOC110247593 [Exaiptasia diaphana]|uniref:Uncharacterized protein n=1 Tax=Exaiptasia diaphana TaxID=2652724 RepID=A0A913XTZ9_EXADI|nr:uncharacterized protein LOC110247593 [Exaiptasia diaphana]
MLGDTSNQDSKLKKSQIANHNLSAGSVFNTFPSTAKTKENTGRTTSGGQSSSKLVPCKFTSNGLQCQELVSKRSKSGYCTAHRTVVRITKQGISKASRAVSSEPTKVDKAEQLESLHCLSESSTASQVPQATEQLPHDVFNMEDDEQESENEDSPGSASFQYEGDDDLVIDLPE